MRDRALRVLAECGSIAAMTEEPGRITRRFLSAPMHLVHGYLRDRMERMGMTVHVDGAGNLRGLWQPPATSGKRLLIGSHVDTVPDAGVYDGVLGVAMALEWAHFAQELNAPIDIEVIAFSEEEGVRFGIPFIGSRAVAGRFDETLLDCTDADGITMGDAIRSFGLDPAAIRDAVLDPSAIGFVEIHIEQGPVLEAEGLSLAAVNAIVGQTRLSLEFTGHANHAGTTPMRLRHDALSAAAEWITPRSGMEWNGMEWNGMEWNGEGGREGGRGGREGGREGGGEGEGGAGLEGLVATVGKINVKPNAANVVPGVASVSLDLRHAHDASRISAVEKLIESANAVAERRGLAVQRTDQLNQPAIPMDERLTSFLLDAIEATGIAPKLMTSGAGHDAMVMAARVPTAMLFVRSPGGLSHHPGEAVLEGDVEVALKVGQKFLERLAADLRQIR